MHFRRDSFTLSDHSEKIRKELEDLRRISDEELSQLRGIKVENQAELDTLTADVDKTLICIEDIYKQTAIQQEQNIQLEKTQKELEENLQQLK
jgi:DNA repair exonuclease SbcCD ATPase subunit